jgi:DNA-binding response OmpR family regulator
MRTLYDPYMASVVVVEDSVTLRERLRQVLVEAGHAVRAFGDAEQALDSVRETPPDLMISDVVLPGMSGIALVKAVREVHDRLDLPVIIVSSLETTEEVTRGYAAGADDYLLKPVQSVELLTRIRVLLGRRDHARSAVASAEGDHWERYERLELLGRGEAATIHRARRRGDGLEVVLKAVTPDAPEGVTRLLLSEAELLRSLGELPSIVRVRDVGQDGGCAYYAMQWVPGETLRARIEHEGPLSVARSARIVRGLSQALAALGQHQVVHGDVKPSNVVVTEGDGVVLIDFGLARRVGAPFMGHAGTLAYMAPEILRGEGGEPPSDVYALGVLFFESLTGGFPYAAHGDELAALKIEGAPADLSPLLERDVPPGLVAALEGCLHTNPDRRASAEQLVSALLPYQGALA